jgi:hypothetical protein
MCVCDSDSGTVKYIYNIKSVLDRQTSGRGGGGEAVGTSSCFSMNNSAVVVDDKDYSVAFVYWTTSATYKQKRGFHVFVCVCVCVCTMSV